MAKKKKKYYDYQVCLNDFAKSLQKLRDHLAKHNLYVGVEEDLIQMDKAIAFLKEPDYYSWPEEGTGWDDGWNHIRDNIRKWWD